MALHQANWNAEDIEKFNKVSWKSENLQFFSAKGVVKGCEVKKKVAYSLSCQSYNGSIDI